MGLRYSTVTGVARDDHADGATGLYAETIRQIHALNPHTGVEILPPDFGAEPAGRPGLRRPAGGARAQPRNRAADLQADPPGLHLREVAAVLAMAREAELVTKSDPHPGHG